MGTKRRKQRSRRVRIDDILYPYDDAKEDVDIDRSLMDIWKGKRGRAGECMNWQCIMRQTKAFPHPVLAASVIGSRVYILDSFEHAVRYTLTESESAKIAQHDELGVASPGTITLRAPRGVAKKGSDHRSRGIIKRNYNGKHTQTLPRGEKARLIAVVGAIEGGSIEAS